MDKEQYTIAYDYDGVADHLPIVPNSAIITGRYRKDLKELRKVVGNTPIFFLPSNIEHTLENIGKHKVETIKKLGVKKFYEDTPEILDILKRELPDVEIVEVKLDGMRFVTITSGWDGCPIAYHLGLDGEQSILSQVQDYGELNIEKEKEDPEDKKERLSQYEGMMKKVPAREMVDLLKKVEDKDNYFIFCDQNNLFEYAEELLEAGFTKGLFPTKEDFEFEKGREEAMKFVEEYYPEVKIIPHQKIATVEEAKAIVTESEVPLVIQSEGDHVSTICPVDDVEQNKTEILSALDKYAKDYAKGEILLKEKLVKPIEITPQIVFWNGEPVFTDLDLETKNIGDGENNGNQVGCGSNLIIRTEFTDRINEIAFPPIVYEMAKKRKGIFVWDISLYITDDGIYFGEFCSNRFGYDALMTEMTMAGGASRYFTAIMNGQNPLKKHFGGAVRVFNLNKAKETEITVGNHPNTWLYESKKEDEKLVSVGDCWDLGVITAAADSIEKTVDEVYNNLNSLSFKEKYTRTKADFLASYPTSILLRFTETNHKYYEAPDLKETSKSEEEISDTLTQIQLALKRLKDKYVSEVDEDDEEPLAPDITSTKKEVKNSREIIRNQLNTILNGN